MTFSSGDPQEARAGTGGTGEEALAPATTPLPAPVSSAQPETDTHPYAARFGVIQTEFIDDPRATVQKADKLAQEVADRAVEKIRAGVEQIRSKTGEAADTERLRLAMREYRELIRSLGRGPF